MASDHGVDLSSHNSVGNWADVHTDGITFASVKLSQGNYYRSPIAAGQVAGARSVGIAAGGYCFGDPRDGAQSNVDLFVGIGRQLDVFSPGSFLPMLDVEDDPGDGIEWDPTTANTFVPQWIALMRAETGIRDVAVYANLDDWENLLRPNEWADDHVFLWLAEYNGQPGTVGWSHRRLAIHQHTSQGNVPGIQGFVDKNVTINGFSVDDLILRAQQREDDDMACSVWFWHNKDTGQAALVYPDGRMTGVSAGTDPSDVIQADNIPVLTCDNEMWEDQRAKSDLVLAAQTAVVTLANASSGSAHVQSPLLRQTTPGVFTLTEHRVLVPAGGQATNDDSADTTSTDSGRVVSPNPED